MNIKQMTEELERLHRELDDNKLAQHFFKPWYTLANEQAEVIKRLVDVCCRAERDYRGVHRIAKTNSLYATAREALETADYIRDILTDIGATTEGEI